MKTIVYFVLFLLLFGACLDEPDCFGLNNNIIGISYRNLNAGDTTTLRLTGLSAEGTEVVFLGDTAVSKVYLPLNYFENTTTFFFHQKDTVRKLVLTYNAKAQFVSAACGERFVLSELAIADHQFDSLRLVDARPGKGNVTNIEIIKPVQ